MRSVIQKELGNKFRIYLWPENGEGIPDNREMKLVILPPEDAGNQIKEWTERRGNNFREYKNTLFFALADTAGFSKLREDIKTYLALHDIQKEIKSGGNQLLEGKRDEVDTRIKNITRDYSYNVRRMYHVVHYGDSNGGRINDLANLHRERNPGWLVLARADLQRPGSDPDSTSLPDNREQVHVAERISFHKRTPRPVLQKNPELPALSEPGVLAGAIQFRD